MTLKIAGVNAWLLAIVLLSPASAQMEDIITIGTIPYVNCHDRHIAGSYQTDIYESLLPYKIINGTSNRILLSAHLGNNWHQNQEQQKSQQNA